MNKTVYFHNLKFDGEFLLSWLFQHGFRHVTDKKQATSSTFTTLISDKGAFYAMTIYFSRKGHKTHKVEIRDSLKVLPFSVNAIAKGFGLPLNKLEIDYDEYRAPGHALTDHEIQYLKHDVKIVALALEQLFGQGLEKMTQGSNALFDFKRMFGKSFLRVFPVLDYETDQNIRPAYKGGFCYLKPDEANIDQGAGLVFDVNSLYPSVMYYRPLPVGFPVPFKRKYRFNRRYPLYVQCIRCQLKLKPRHIPTVQLKKSFWHGKDGEYLIDTKGEDITIYLTNMDIELLFEHYDVICPEYLGGFMFQQGEGLFKSHIDKWMKVKAEATISGNKAQRQISKIMMNALYGKFALNPNVMSNVPLFDGEVVQYRKGEKETRDGIYIPVGLFITSWARYTTITAAQQLYDRFIYADTDSLHIKGTDIPSCLDIDPVKLGAWKHELTFSRARYIRAKTYMEYGTEPGSGQPEEWKITACGMPSKCYDNRRRDSEGNPIDPVQNENGSFNMVTFDNFQLGAVYTGKLLPHRVPGGVVLVEDTFTIRG